MSRNILPMLPQRTDRYQEHIHQRMEADKERQRQYHDRHAGSELRPLVPEQQIRVTNHQGTWAPARVVRKGNEPRSYVIETANGNRLRRNRRHLRPARHDCQNTDHAYQATRTCIEDQSTETPEQTPEQVPTAQHPHEVDWKNCLFCNHVFAITTVTRTTRRITRRVTTKPKIRIKAKKKTETNNQMNK
ncbi:hypothetical protein CAPTEDRAFT_202919 [Capitella teleta]|uniref:Uncharacterized protein n=1 Tax=Capitella teleta TaxID=283909 RepID=R7TY43_CAPTE|nr:hypothetical protein CAPTEDRAFT_202919 [Capitella teleta]|eukprot:ELT95880.1 hypothetical protein CAPTEDRAFT_202919 [Capitella teleta]